MKDLEEENHHNLFAVTAVRLGVIIDHILGPAETCANAMATPPTNHACRGVLFHGLNFRVADQAKIVSLENFWLYGNHILRCSSTLAQCIHA